MKRSDFRFADPLRVRWAEVDMQKVVFNGHYLMYVDTAMGNWWRALALPYEDTLAALDGDLFVRKSTLEYLAPARYDDALEIGIRFESAGTSSLRFVAAVFRGAELLVHGEIVYVWTDAVTKQPRPAPKALVDAFRAYEAGEAMVSVTVGGWDALGAEAQAIRTAVFVEEQKVPLALERDAADAVAVHALARNRLGLAVGTGRLLAADAPGHPARIGRMAVSRTTRGAGIGRALLEALMVAAGQRGDTQVGLHAQVSAFGFYRRAGFVPHGERFEEAGIVHQEMRRAP
jgi:YbgC/YbaW family acyl-CoA thioester hydrolase